jgi:Leucine-rich repeat (LRR) protein
VQIKQPANEDGPDFETIRLTKRATLDERFELSDIDRLPEKLAQVQICHGFEAEHFHKLAAYFRRNPATCLRLFTILGDASPYDDLWPLDFFESLQKLRIYLVHLESLSRVEQMSGSLELLSVDCTHSRHLDFSWLANARKLKSLWLVGHVQAISELNALSRLRRLHLTSIKTKKPFPGVSNSLQHLELMQCRFLNLDWLGDMSKLKYLQVQSVSTEHSSTSDLPLPPSLVALDLGTLNCNELPPMDHLVNLKYLTLHGTKQLSDLCEITKLPSLQKLAISGTKFLNLDSFGDLGFYRKLKQFQIDLSSNHKRRELSDSLCEVVPNTSLGRWLRPEIWPRLD